MRTKVLTLIAALSIAMPVMADAAKENVVLTPTKLYEMVHSANVLNYERNKEIKEKLDTLERDLIHLEQAAEYRVQELERKVAGMQKQIAVLHAKLKGGK